MCLPAVLAAGAASSAAAGTAAAGAAAAGTAAAGTAAAASTAAASLTTAQMITLGLSAASTALGVASAYSTSQTQKAVAKNNARTGEIQAQDALRRGEQEAMDIRRRGAAIKSSQRVALAAKGLDLGYGTAGDLQDETDFFTAADESIARNNARKEAWARRAQVANFQAEAAASRPWMAAGGTLLGGATQVADRWYQYRGR